MGLLRTLRRLLFRRRAGDVVAACRDLQWEGFEDLHAAEAEGRGVLLIVDPGADVAVARHALETFLAPPAVWVSEPGEITAGPGRWLAAPPTAGAREALETAAVEMGLGVLAVAARPREDRTTGVRILAARRSPPAG